ncbi:homeobox protein HMX3 [Nephila pilipes]|uniref:Homeobox protein HMX3 n=1 Tax=Nephila pilipes TaxID=299642 RepID=A0A8X6P6A9_NEPPI|nr:homeobox protein HMX3 [Nephila pilipes]
MSILMSENGEDKTICSPNASDPKSALEEIKPPSLMPRNSFSIASILSRDDPKKEVHLIPSEVNACIARRNFQNIAFEPRLALMRHAQNFCNHQQHAFVKQMYPHYAWNPVTSRDENRNNSSANIKRNSKANIKKNPKANHQKESHTNRVDEVEILYKKIQYCEVRKLNNEPEHRQDF